MQTPLRAGVSALQNEPRGLGLYVPPPSDGADMGDTTMPKGVRHDDFKQLGVGEACHRAPVSAVSIKPKGLDMKFTMQSIALAAALVASNLAFARTITLQAGQSVQISDPQGGVRSVSLPFSGGSGSLEFSNGTGVLGGVPTTAVGGLVGALNVGKVIVTGVDDALVNQQTFKVGRSMARAVVNIAASVQSVSLDDQTGQVLTVNSFGGARQEAATLDGVLDGGRVTVRNLKFDLAHKTVYADLTGQALQIDGTYGPEQQSLNTALWSIGSIQGPTAIPPTALLAASQGDTSQLQALGFQNVTANGGFNGGVSFNASNVLSNLKVTPEGFQFFATSLGLTEGSTGYTTLNSVNQQSDGWGSIQSTLVFAVPEPSTYALMGLGLVGITLVARRRQLS